MVQQYRSHNASAVVPDGSGTFSPVVMIPPWTLPDGSGPFDVWITGWSVIYYPYPGWTPLELKISSLTMATGHNGEHPRYNFGLTTELTDNFDLPEGYGFFFPADTLTEQQSIVLFGWVERIKGGRPGYVAFVTLRYALASEVTGMKQINTKTFYNTANQQVDFLVKVQAWENQEFDLLGAECAVIGKHRQASVCNSVNPDILMNWAYPRQGARYFFQPEQRIRFPVSGSPGDNHLDCHIDLWLPPIPQVHTAFVVPYYHLIP